MDDLYYCGTGPWKISRENSGGNIDEAEFTHNDCKNHPSKLRKNKVGRHCTKVLQYFQSKAGIEDVIFLDGRRWKQPSYECFLG